MFTLAAKILILGGLLNLVFGLITGIPASNIRMKQASYPKYLRLAHTGPLLWCPILISLAFAIEMSQIAENWETAAAILLLLASITLGAKDTLNWLMKVEDEFAERPILPLALGGISTLCSFTGAGILLVGVILAF